MSAEVTVTAELVREYLSYDPDTGVFRWIKRRSKISVGQNAGRKGKNGYHAIGLFGRRYYVHRLAWLYMTGRWPAHQIDHRDGDRGNAKWSNLREATGPQNSYNQRAQASSGLKGVYRNTQKSEAWSAKICKDGQRFYLGSFSTKEEAHAAYAAKARELFGEFARVA